MGDFPGSSSTPKVCRYYVSGSCARGSDCRYSHDRSQRDETVCRFYLSGNCTFGTACRYTHVRPKPEKTGASNTQKKAAKVQPPKPPVPAQLAKPGLNIAAAEFVPSWKKVSRGSSYAAAAGAAPRTEEEEQAARQLCPYFEMKGECSRQDCIFVHGDLCEMCSRYSLHPFNENLRHQHFKECLASHELAMNEAFATANSMDKSCGICMENILEKNLRFGILKGCKHCFCLNCIREWRRKHESLEFDSKVVRSCPECRQHSDYVVPSVVWVEDEEEKNVLIQMYIENTKTKVCKYYANGSMSEGCPFGNKCFYKHQMPDGSIDPGEDPHVRRRPKLSEFLASWEDEDEEDWLEGMMSSNAISEATLRRVLKEICELKKEQMYESTLDATRLAAAAVDAVRETTDAPLEQCHNAVLAVFHLLEPHLSGAQFTEIRNAAVNYTVNIKSCYDRRSLEAICSRLFDIFVEKQELSYSSSQDDVELIRGLELFTDITKKTDARIPLEIVSSNDFEWVTQLVSVIQMDQNSAVRQVVVDCLAELVRSCRDPIVRLLIESRLSTALVSILSIPPSLDAESAQKKLQSSSLSLLALLYSTDVLPPLDHFSYLNDQFFAKLVRSLDYYDGVDVLELIVNVTWLLLNSDLSAESFFASLTADPSALTALCLVLIQEINQNCTERRIRFLLCVFALGEDVVAKIFYRNDLVALAGILAREMMDRTDNKIKEGCRSAIEFLIECKVVDKDDLKISEALRDYEM
ncbi:unnamed protein product [Caenorhabditis auriculariae]|uniref:RING-type E3 ubiquitin transferase n=1 Tax=Caenorhabditis auriculariae TaxID=2777116 RepID=A0A8S1HPK0_9PELO|nr:unnamed protein product [Caenorhabditis auriculariae]